MKNKLYKLFLGFVTLLQMPCFAADTTDATFYQDTFGWTKLHRTVALYKFDKDRFWEDQEDQENAYAENFKNSLPVSLPREYINKPDKAGRTPLHLAIMCGNQAAIKVLKDTGKADENARDFFGLTPADYAKEAHDVHPSKDQNYIDLLMLFAPFVFSSEALADRFFDDGKNIIIKKKHPDQQEQLIKYFIDEQLKSEEKIDFTKHGLTPENVYSLLAAPELLIANTREQIVPLLNQAKPFTSYIKTVEVAHELALIQIDTACKKIIQSYQKDLSSANKRTLLKTLTSFYEKFETLFEKGKFPWLPLLLAAIKQDWAKAVKFFLEKRPELLIVIDTNKKSLLHHAAEAGSVKVLIYLIKTKKFDLNAQDEKGNTALHYATTSNNLYAVKLLYDSGANVNIWNNNSLNPILYYPSHTNKKDPLLLHLLQYHTESDIRYHGDKHLPCNYVYSYYSYDKLKEKLLYIHYKKRRAFCLYFDEELTRSWSYRLTELIKYSPREIIDKFITYSQPCLQMSNYSEALKYLITDDGYIAAIKKGYLDIAHKYAQENNHVTPLCDVVKYNDLKSVKDLVEKYKSSVNQQESITGNTPLHIAAELGKTDVAEYLISQGASLSIPNDSEKIPYDCIDNTKIQSPEEIKKMNSLLRPNYWTNISHFMRVNSDVDFFGSYAQGVGFTDRTLNDLCSFTYVLKEMYLTGLSWAAFPISLECFIRTSKAPNALLPVLISLGAIFETNSLYSSFKSFLLYKYGIIEKSWGRFLFKTKPTISIRMTKDLFIVFIKFLFKAPSVMTLATCAASLPTKYAAFLWPITAFEALKLWYMTPCVDWSYQDWKQKLFGSKLRTALTLGAGTLVTATATALLAKRYPAVLSTLQSTGKFVSSALPKLWGNRILPLKPLLTHQSLKVA